MQGNKKSITVIVKGIGGTKRQCPFYSLFKRLYDA